MFIGTRRNPKAPSFRSSSRLEKNLSGTLVSFVVPASRPAYSDSEWGSGANVLDLYDSEGFEPVEAADKSSILGLSRAKLYTDSWTLNGLPILDGHCGSLNCLFEVRKVDDQPVNESLFDNEVFVREVYRYLELADINDLHEAIADDPFDVTLYKWPNYLTPLNCQWLSRGKIDWFYYEDQPLANGVTTITWCTAISDKHYFSGRFFIKRSAPNAGNPYRIEQVVSADNFLAFMHKIMDSFTIELSPSAKLEQARAASKTDPQPRPTLACTLEQIEEAKRVLHHYSGFGYTEKGGDRNVVCRADLKEIADFIDERVKPKPLPGSYSDGFLLDQK